MKPTFAVLPLFAAFAAAAPAQAQDAAVAGPLTVRAELNFGYDELRARYQFNNFGQSAKFGESGVTAGAEAGVDFNIGNASIGGYAGINSSQVESCNGDVIVTNDDFCFNAGRSLRAGVRGGLRTGDGGMIYVKGGVSRARLQASYTRPTTVTLAPGVRFDDSATARGYHVGAGAELGLGGGAYAKGEYLYESYNSTFAVPTGDRVKPTRQMILFGVGFRFGG
jgi:opacity protein-like surface antigen